MNLITTELFLILVLIWAKLHKLFYSITTKFFKILAIQMSTVFDSVKLFL